MRTKRRGIVREEVTARDLAIIAKLVELERLVIEIRECAAGEWDGLIDKRDRLYGQILNIVNMEDE